MCVCINLIAQNRETRPYHANIPILRVWIHLMGEQCVCMCLRVFACLSGCLSVSVSVCLCVYVYVRVCERESVCVDAFVFLKLYITAQPGLILLIFQCCKYGSTVCVISDYNRARVYVFIKLHISEQPGPVILTLKCCKHGSTLWGISVYVSACLSGCVSVCVCAFLSLSLLCI